MGIDSTENMTVKQVAEYLGISQPSVYTLVQNGAIFGWKYGQRWEFLRSEIETWKHKNLSEQSCSLMQKPVRQRIVQMIAPRKHLKEVRFADDDTTLLVPRSACITKGDQVELTESAAWVICKNGKAQIFPVYEVLELLQLGGLELQFVVKEITEPEELSAYQALTEFHYRSRTLFGRTATLVIRNFHPIYPKIIGYIEISTSFYMNTARKSILDAPFQAENISWEAWDKETSRHYIHVIARIARCVVYPEFRGLGLGQLLIKHAAEFARNRWQIANIKPYFLEISADMLKFVPFAQKAGMVFIGETEGNLNRVAKDMAYLLKNFQRVQDGEIVKEESCGIIDQQVSRMRRAALLMKEEGWTIRELVERLEKLSHESVLKDFNLFHDIVSLPKPTYLKGLVPDSEDFLRQRVNKVSPKNGHVRPTIDLEPLKESIHLQGISLTYQSNVRRTQQTHAIHQAFSISPDDISHKVLSHLNLTLNPGEVVLITGSSGSGKTTLLNLLTKGTCTRLTGDIQIPSNYRVGNFAAIRSQKALIEVIGNRDIRSALHLMGLVGLSDAFVYLKRFEELSNGQQYRAKLAQLIAGGYNVWIADEFCATLDLVTANVVADRLQKIARQLNALLIVASSQPEVFARALCPDQVVQLTTAWEHRVMSGSEFLQPFSAQRSNSSAQTLSIAVKYLSAVRSGQKCSTIRKGRLKFNKGLLILNAKTGDFVSVNVTDVKHTRFRCLTEGDAVKDGFSSLTDLQKALLEHYPNMSVDGWVTIVSFDTSCKIRQS
ncbi:GNAT family N-acetyltransferase [Altericista sp. CCNU0014]|uniref:GNAT family N-acetyltransferase n=1 Tax=Altericista sp. CCNU0014 TaxID=3082949 RepID=UPI00384BDC21